MSRRHQTKRNAFEQTEPAEVTAIYGDSDELVLTGAKVEVATPIDIMLLKADRTQPRRAIPLSIQNNWDGGAKGMYNLLEQWRMKSEDELGTEIKMLDILQGRTEGIDVDPRTQPVTDKFIQLLNLATGIRREGLLNPILIDRTGKGGRIIAGERRWLAHHVLKFYLPGDESQKWTQIAAFDSAPNVWAQAQENGNRSPLNAIEMARQLALLIMDMYEGDDGIQFDSYDALVTNSSDRRFYAQVADGQVFRIKRGFGDKILEATGLKSRDRVSQYRDLLNLDDKNWRMADENNWTEGRCRRILHPEQFVKKESDMSSIEDVSPPIHWQDTPPPPPSEKPPEARELDVGEGYSQRYEPIIDKSKEWLLPSEMNGWAVDDELADEQALVEQAIWDIEVDDTPPSDFSRSPQQAFDNSHRLRPQNDTGDNVPFITLHDTSRWLLNRVEDMARYMDMKKEHDALRQVNLWTPETIRKKMADGGYDAIDAEKKIVEDAIHRIFNIFWREFDGLLKNIEDSADNINSDK